MRRFALVSTIVGIAMFQVFPASARHLTVGGSFFKHAHFGMYRCVVKFLPSGVVINTCVKKAE